jgi:hypothetical protein
MARGVAGGDSIKDLGPEEHTQKAGGEGQPENKGVCSLFGGVGGRSGTP